MNWRHETWRKLYAREEGSFAALSYWARSLAAMLLKLCDDRGRIFARPGEVVEEAVCFRLAADQGARRVIRRALVELKADGYLVRTDGCLRIRNFGRAQVDEPATSGAPDGREPDASQARVELESGSSADRVGIEDCVKPAESPEPPEKPASVAPTAPVAPRSEVARSVRSDLISTPEADPDPERAIPGHWLHPGQEEVTYHHAVARALPPDPRNLRHRSPPPPGPAWTAQRLLDRFGKIREETIAGALSWQVAGRGLWEKARELAEQIPEDAAADVEQTMRTYLEQIKSSTDPRDGDPHWVFSCWVMRFTRLREDLRGVHRAHDPDAKPCAFHSAGANTGRLPVKHRILLSCPECKHLNARASPRPASEPKPVGELLGGG